MNILGFNKPASLLIKLINFEFKLHQLLTGQPQTAPLITRNQLLHW